MNQEEFQKVKPELIFMEKLFEKHNPDVQVQSVSRQWLDQALGGLASQLTFKWILVWQAMTCYLYIIGWMLLYRHIVQHVHGLADFPNWCQDPYTCWHQSPHQPHIEALASSSIGAPAKRMCISNSWCWNTLLMEGWGGQSCLHESVQMHCNVLLLST